MKLFKEYYAKFEEILRSQGYRKQDSCTTLCDFSFYKVIYKNERYCLQIMIDFYDFSENNFCTNQIGFIPKVSIGDVDLKLPFCESEDKSIFNFYDPEPEDKQYYKPREFKTEEVQLFLGNLENIASRFNVFYLEELNKRLKRSFRKK